MKPLWPVLNKETFILGRGSSSCCDTSWIHKVDVIVSSGNTFVTEARDTVWKYQCVAKKPHMDESQNTRDNTTIRTYGCQKPIMVPADDVEKVRGMLGRDVQGYVILHIRL